VSDTGHDYEYAFPAIRGIQAGQEYFVSMCPLRLIPKIFLFNEEEILPELRAQRLINRARVPEIAKYISENRKSYVFSALTASIDAEVRFAPASNDGTGSRLGVLHVPMTAQFIINDGQHRRAAIEIALRESPELGNETIAVVFFLDSGLKRCQQMFADLNRYAVRTSRSMGVLYDHRDEQAEVARRVVAALPFFRELVEMERTTLSGRSRRLFTLSALYGANVALLSSIELELDELVGLASEFWSTVSKCLPEWELVRQRKLTAGEVREDFIHSHGVVLQAIGRAGNALIKAQNDGWKEKLRKLSKINWSRTNRELWEGRALVSGRLSKATHNVILTANIIKSRMGLPLNPEEQMLESGLRSKKRA
jgi:DNA sulfur modification protein DndB